MVNGSYGMQHGGTICRAIDYSDEEASMPNNNPQQFRFSPMNRIDILIGDGM